MTKAQTQTGPTPTPWKATNCESYGRTEHERKRTRKWFTIGSAVKRQPVMFPDWIEKGGCHECSGCMFPNPADVDLIITAVNAHAALLEACEAAHSALDRLMGDSDLPDDDSPEMQACLALRAAIALARGGEA